MARPTKQGINYFSMDCDFDDKTELFLIEKGAVGLAFLVTLWQLIYSNNGYYILNNKDLSLLIKRRINIDINEVNDCINLCFDRHLLDKSMHEKYGILTSKAIQTRFLEAAQKRKKVEFDVNYALTEVNGYKNLVNVGKNTTKKRKEKKRIINGGINSTFTVFWEKYPRKDNKIKSEAAWNKLSPDEQKSAIDDCQIRYIETEQRFIPMPTTYINGKRWQDESPSATAIPPAVYGANGI